MVTDHLLKQQIQLQQIHYLRHLILAVLLLTVTLFNFDSHTLQAPETGNAYSHYYWGIDDVVVSSNENADDLAMVQLTNGDIWNVWEYRVTPMEQAISAADGGVLAGVLIPQQRN